MAEEASSEAQFRIVLGQRASWPELLARTRETEALGFDGLFLVDHFYGLFDVMDPTHEAYTMLAALAPFTQSLRLGVLVCGNTYRNPAFLLKQAVTVDHISGGRVDFGVGAGWTEREHEAYGWPFPIRPGAGRPLCRGARDLGPPAARGAHDVRRPALPDRRCAVRAETAAAAADAVADRRLGAAHAPPRRAPRRHLECRRDPGRGRRGQSAPRRGLRRGRARPRLPGAHGQSPHQLAGVSGGLRRRRGRVSRGRLPRHLPAVAPYREPSSRSSARSRAR